MVQAIPVTISYGDDAAVMDAVLDVARESGAVIEVEIIASGEDIYRREIKEGIMPDIYESLKRTGILIKSATRTPKEEGYIAVSDAICQKLQIENSLEYYVGKNSAGVGVVTEKMGSPLRVENIAEFFNLSKALGGKSFCYTIDELGLMIQQKQEKFPGFTSKYLTVADAMSHLADYDVIFTDEDNQKEIVKVIKAASACKIFAGNGFKIFEPLDEYNKDGKGLLLAMALAVKYSGQNDAAWEMYKYLVDSE